jgi:hypothetical protein
LAAKTGIVERLDAPIGVVDLTFASVSLRGRQANVKSETTPGLVFASVPMVLTFANEPAAI